MAVAAFLKALKNLLLPGIIKLFLLCLLAYGVGWTLLSWLIGLSITHFIGLDGSEGFIARALSTVGSGVLAWFLFPLLYPVLMSFFDDYMAEAIEREDYPQLPAANPPFWPTLWQDALFSLKAIGLNIIGLPVYLFVPIFGQLFYFLLNGYLLGGQFFRMAAGRRMNMADAESLRRRNNTTIMLAGVAVMVCSTIPLLNLAAPLLGVATLLHLFHALNGTGKVEVLGPGEA